MIQGVFIIVVFSTLHVPCTTHVNVHQFCADLDDSWSKDLPERYLSLALDSGLLRRKWEGLDFGSVKLHTLARGLSPAYLRFGGTAADYMHFDAPGTAQRWTDHPTTPFNITKLDVRSLYNFCHSVGWHLVFDLNALVRTGSDWDPSNPVQLLHYMASQGMMSNLSLQLGNEPNSYKHSANVSLTATQVAKDFLTLVDIIHTDPELYKSCNHCQLVGPDVTRPKLQGQARSADHLPASAFLNEYLQVVNGSLDAITWHQYYVNGRATNMSEFTSPVVLDYLPQQIQIIQDTVAKAGYHGYPVWLGETSSAYGGGAPGLSDTYAAGFMWLDKLGVSSRDGLDVVIRQSLYGGNYALLDKDTLDPRPDYWLSLVYKRLVGQRVLNVTLNPDTRHLRLYAHCTNKMSEYPSGSIVFYGLNLYDHAVNVSVDVKTGAGQYLDKYLLTPAGQLTSKYVQLNGETLLMPNKQTLPPIYPQRLQLGSDLYFPAKTFGFYVLSGAHIKPCISSAHAVEPA